MSEAEISPSGAVLVEGHHVGELQGFRFTADQSAGGEDAKAVKAAAQKALAAEFEARADRFAASANHDIALASDGTLRWIGAPVGTLVAGEDALKPRLVLLADEQLTGLARDKVAARAERYVEYQVGSLLKPLVDLKGAESLAGIARGIAFQLVENFGVLNRRDVADEIRSLDQEGRAALRRLGVRFGAYHIFVPTLLKPAPAGLVTLLWALKNDGKDKPGFGDVVNALAAGRTSVVVDPSFDRTFYRLAGFRVLGRRAVRIDILERLADLIRPALSWKPGQGQRPDAAFDGSGFMVTPPMMSILGATADDIEEILKGLGYRADARPAADVKARLAALDEAAAKAVAEVAARVAAEAAAKAAAEAQAEAERIAALQAEAAAGEDAALTAEAEQADMRHGPVTEEMVHHDTAPFEQAQAEPHHHAELMAEPEGFVSHAHPEEAAALQAEAAAGEDAALTGADAPLTPSPSGDPEPGGTRADDEAGASSGTAPAQEADRRPAETAAAEASPGADGQAAAAEPAEEPKPILVWRPGRFDRPRRHDGRGRNFGRQGAGQGRDGGRPAEARTDAGAGEAGRQQRGDRRPGNFRRGDGERPQRDRPEGEGGKQRFERKFGKPGGRDGERRDGGRGEGKGSFSDRRKDAGNGAERGKAWSTEKPREERAPRFDPNSPFAKLAALRDQLKK